MPSDNDRMSEAPHLLGHFELAESPEGDPPRSWIQVLITGDFNHPRYGKFAISAEDLAGYAGDIEARAEKIPIDFDHESAQGKTRAAGWYTGRTRIDVGEPSALWAEVEWTPTGASAIKSKEYRYISAEFGRQWRDSFGKVQRQLRMHAAALTNRPFLPDMAPVTLSEPPADAYFIDDERFRALDKTYGADVASVIRATATSGEPSEARALARDLIDNTPAVKEAEVMPEKDPIIAVLELDEDADDEAVLAAITEAKESATKTAELEQKVAELEKRPDVNEDTLKTLTAQAAQGAEAAKKLHDLERDTLLTRAVEEGKILPVQKDAYASMYDADAENVRTLIEATPARSFDEIGSGNGRREGGTGNVKAGEFESTEADGVDPDSLKVHARAVEMLAEKGKHEYTNEDYVAAAEQAADELNIVLG